MTDDSMLHATMRLVEAAFRKRDQNIRTILGTGPICDRCGATLDTLSTQCVADLEAHVFVSDACPGHFAYERARLAADATTPEMSLSTVPPVTGGRFKVRDLG